MRRSRYFILIIQIFSTKILQGFHLSEKVIIYLYDFLEEVTLTTFRMSLTP